MPCVDTGESLPPRFPEGSEIIPGALAWAKLGSGPFCESWMAWSIAHGRPVTVKIARDDANVSDVRHVLHREAGHLGRLAHPAFQRLLGGDLHSGVPYIVLEYVEGQPLDALLEEHGPLPIRDALNIATELLAALGYLHRAGLIHMDVNPSNIILRDGRIVVLDLGLACPIGKQLSRTALYGTQGYIAPEHWDDARTSPTMDVFSVGSTLFELLTGQTPNDFDGPPVEPLASVGRPRSSRRRNQLDQLIARLTCLDQANRPADVHEALVEVGAVRSVDDRMWPDFVDGALACPLGALPAWVDPEGFARCSTAIAS